MAYALIANTAAATSDTFAVTTGAINTTGANLIVIAVTDYVGLSASPTPTCNQGNTYVGLTGQEASGFTHIRLWYLFNPTTNASHTFSSPTTGQIRHPTILVAAFSGAQSSPFDQQNGTTGSTPIAAGSITPSQDNELIISAVGFNATGGATVNESMSETNDVEYESGVNLAGVMAYKIQTTATAINPTWALSSSESAAVVASFKAATNLGRLILRTPA